MSHFPAVTTSRDARFAAFIFCGAVVLFLVGIGMLVPLFSGLLAISLVIATRQRVGRIGNIRGATAIAIAALAAMVSILVLAMAAGLHLVLRDATGFHDLLERMAEIIASAKAWLPESIAALIPQPDTLFDSVGAWFRGHAAELGSMSLAALKQFGYAVIGILLGALIALHQKINDHPSLGPVSTILAEQIMALRLIFWRVATAQVKISAINTLLSALYLFVVLPGFGVHLPLTKTLTTLTFVTGLLPVVGNLLSNTAITVISLGYSLPVGLASLAFLIGVHKLEYFLNARIVGSQINARTWEILIAMIVLERIFGLRGVVLAPIFYAWLKSEWHFWDQPDVNPEAVRQLGSGALPMRVDGAPGRIATGPEGAPDQRVGLSSGAAAGAGSVEAGADSAALRFRFSSFFAFLARSR